jgi:hypothetical protein
VGSNWMRKFKQELEKLDVTDIWKNGRNNDKGTWMIIKSMFSYRKGKIWKLH